MPKEEWDAVCRHVKIVEVDCKRREHEKDSAIERIITVPMKMTTHHTPHIATTMTYKEMVHSPVTASSIRNN